MYPTIQAGIDAASNGDTVLVAPGTYVENIYFKGKAITVTSSGGAAATIIDGGGVPGTGTVNFQSPESSVGACFPVLRFATAAGSLLRVARVGACMSSTPRPL